METPPRGEILRDSKETPSDSREDLYLYMAVGKETLVRILVRRETPRNHKLCKKTQLGWKGPEEGRKVDRKRF